MKHAILILSHKGINYIKNTINQFSNYNEFEFYIHIDKKSHIQIKDITDLYQYDKRIKYITSLYSCNYMKFSIIEAELHLLDMARKNNYDYYHLFSEQCRIICTPEYFLDYFRKNNNIEYITCENAKCNKWEKWRVYDESINHIYWGSQWWSLTNNCVQNYIFNNKLSAYVKYYRTSINNKQAADEVFFQNIIVEHENDLLISYYNNLRFVDWERPLVNKMHPHLLKEYKWWYDEYLNKQDTLIVRKIDFKNVDCIKVLNKIRDEFNYEAKEC